MRPLYLSLLLSLLIASPVSAVTMAWTPVGNPGNACDPQSQGCFGAVGYGYQIGTYEVTNAQYAEFLNAVAASDPNALYSSAMSSGSGGILRSGSNGAYAYTAIAGRENMPVNWVDFIDTIRFANWMDNGQPTGAQDTSTTEDGAYTITIQGIANNSIARNPGADFFIPTENEWYKAAYYNPASGSYFDFPTSANAQTICATPSGTANRANCNGAVSDVTPVGSYPGSASPYGTFDQGGNLWEWNEAILPDSSRGLRGGTYNFDGSILAASFRSSAFLGSETVGIGFRVASIVPEPSTGLLVVAGLLGFAGWRRARD